MDNSVQVVKIENIIPVESEENNIDEINNLAESIKEYGIIEPLIVRQNEDKYEIISGKKRYQAAIIAGQSDIPVLVRNIDKNYYKNKENQSSEKTNKFINPIKEEVQEEKKKKNVFINGKKETSNNDEEIEFNLNKYKTTNNNDIINLSELNKEEFERDELKMNNNMLNNQPQAPEMPNNMVQNTTPTFGGRFFPSLEDEPTNMNMGEMNFVGEQGANPIPTNPINTAPANNDLIDLTDINNEPTNQMAMPQPELQPEQPQPMNSLPSEPMPEMNPQPEPIMQPGMQSQMEPIAPMMDPMSVQPSEPQIEENNNVNPINNQMATPTIETFQMPTGPIENTVSIEPQTQETTQFDMSQSVGEINSTQSMPTENIPQNDFISPAPPTLEPTPEISQEMPMSQPMPSMEQPVINQQPYDISYEQQPVNNMAPEVSIPQPEITNTEPMMDNNMEMPIEETQLAPENTNPTIEPVLNTIKSLASNLREFGYNIEINEEDLGTSSRITIDIQK